MNRRKFISASSIAASTLGLLGASKIAKDGENMVSVKPIDARTYWLETLLKISDPVLNNLAIGKLKRICL
jgi:hypothetical protein